MQHEEQLPLLPQSDRTEPEKIVDEILDKWERKRLGIVYLVDSSSLAKWWEFLDVLFSLALCASYILLTVLSIGPRGSETAPPPPEQVYEDVDFVISVATLVQWIPRILLSLDPLEEIRSLWSISTMISTFSVVYVYYDFNRLVGTFLEGGPMVYLFPFRFIRLHGSVSRTFTIGKKGFIQMTPIKQKALSIALSIITVLLSVTAWVHISLYKNQKYYDITFFDIFYSLAVSSTAGLSTEIVPDNIYSRVITLGVIITGLIFLPPKINELVTMVRNHSPYNRSFTPVRKRSHVVVAGNLEVVSLERFLREFYSADHGVLSTTTSVVMLSPHDPSQELINLLSDPIYSGRVKLVKGSPMSVRSLEKVKLSLATAVFVLASRVSDCEPIEEDSKTVMRCVSLRKFNPNIKMFTQVLLPRNKIHLANLADEVMCIEEMKYGMAAQACLSPGFASVLYLLTNSLSDREKLNLEVVDNHKWLSEYLHGSLMEIYEVRLNYKYSGLSVPETALMLYNRFKAVLIAVGYTVSGSSSDGSIAASLQLEFYPASYIFKGNEIIFIVAGDSKTSKLIRRFDVSEYFDDHSRDTIRLVKEHLSLTTTPSPVPDIQIYRKHSLRGSQELPLRLLHNYESSQNRPGADFTVLPMRKKSSRQKDNVEPESPVDQNISSHTTDVTGPTFDALPNTIRSHIVFCSLAKVFPKSIVYFLAPYRHIDSQTTIVILCEGEPEEETRELIESFRNILIVKGTPLLRKDLRKVRIQEAKRTVCFARDEKDIWDPAVDSPMMLSLLNIQAMCPDPGNVVLVEFMHSSNIRLMGQSGLLEYHSSTSSFPAENLIPAFAGGHVFNNSMFHSMLCQSYFEENLLAIIKLLLFSKTDSRGGCSANLFQICLPSDGRFIGLTFESVFTYFLVEYSCVCLGVYRNCLGATSFQYAYLNPEPDALVEDGDCLYMFGATKPEL